MLCIRTFETEEVSATWQIVPSGSARLRLTSFHLLSPPLAPSSHLSPPIAPSSHLSPPLAPSSHLSPPLAPYSHPSLPLVPLSGGDCPRQRLAVWFGPRRHVQRRGEREQRHSHAPCRLCHNLARTPPLPLYLPAPPQERCERVASRLDAGTVWINCSQPLWPQVPCYSDRRTLFTARPPPRLLASSPPRLLASSPSPSSRALRALPRSPSL